MKNILFLSIISICLLGCRAKTTNQAMKKGEVLKSSLESFEKNRSKLSTKVVESLEDAEKSLTTENPDLPKVSKDFEKEWRGIQKRYGKLKSDFEKVGKSSDEYFLQLNELSSNINSEKLKATELAKNEELKNRWQKTYDDAAVAVGKITGVLEAGNDFHMVLVASSIRQKLEQNVDELKVMAEQAKSLLKDLEVFTAAGRALVAG